MLRSQSIHPRQPSTPIIIIFSTQLHQLYATFVGENGKLPVTIIPCARQTNATDCGVYAAAFAFQLAIEGKDGLAHVQGFNADKMRSHRLHCLENSIVAPFPHIRLSKRGRKALNMHIEV